MTDLVEKLELLYQSDAIIFSKIVEIVNLDRANDLRNVDLSLVNFKGSDLRGYDFRGSNLYGTLWFGAKIDKTTLYDDIFSDLVKNATNEDVEHDRNDKNNEKDGFIRSNTD